MQSFLDEKPFLTTKELYYRDTSHLYQPLPFWKKLKRVISRWLGASGTSEYFNGTRTECRSLRRS